MASKRKDPNLPAPRCKAAVKRIIADLLGRPEFEKAWAGLDTEDVHREGKDFRNVTAIRCGVHPEKLKAWLLRGATSQDTTNLYVKLALQFALIEADLRASNIVEVLNTQTKHEEIEFSEKTGLPVKTTKTARSTAGIQWYMERRWRQWRADWQPTEQDSEAATLFTAQATGALNKEAAMSVLGQMAAQMPDEPRAVFEANNWRQLSPGEIKHLEALRRLEGTATDGKT